MVAANVTEEPMALRAILKTYTAPQHARLDERLSRLGLGSSDAYAAFLSVQFAARAPIERWAQDHCCADYRPPAMASLIAADLNELGAPLPPECDFAMPAGGHDLGLAWALGGSALGNRAMLAERRRVQADGPQRFLSDRSMAKFFASLLPHLEGGSEVADGAVAAARTVFETFLAAADAHVYEAAE
ncbi:biliverdin-producing heme oxygenase [Qipengyuania sp.]|uniref:biliverdin-producing heme oxygenase n=1 Tax=Qipengyuania sp. TaxID=2004515 RepID=UPI0035C7D52D